MMRKLAAVVVTAGLMTTVSPALAEVYVDSKAGFRVTIPQGWVRVKHEGSDDFVINSPDTNTTFGFCFVHTFPLPGTETLSQADLDRRLAGKFGVEFWQKSFEGTYKNVVIEDSGVEMQNGRTTRYAVVTYKQIRRTHKFKTVVHILPGRKYDLTCNAYLETYAREEPAFETFFDTFTPIDRTTKN